METLMNILREIDDSIDYEKEQALIDDRLLDSFGVITLVAELEEAFDIEIEASEMIPENFNSAGAIYKWFADCRRIKQCLTIHYYMCFCSSLYVWQFTSLRRKAGAGGCCWHAAMCFSICSAESCWYIFSRPHCLSTVSVYGWHG